MGVAKLQKTLTAKELAKLPIVGRQPESEKEAEYLKEICEFEFYNLEQAGLLIKFPYGDTKNKTYFTFMHGGRYQIPRHVARHVESRSVPLYEYRPNGEGGMIPTKTGEKPRFQMRMIFDPKR